MSIVAPASRLEVRDAGDRARDDRRGPSRRGATTMVKLYSFFRSSAAYRTRIALNLKGLGYETIGIHLQKEGGLNRKADFRAVNPHMRVPALRLESGEVLVQ